MAEKSGGPVSYYLVQVNNPNQGKVPYQAECGDIIEALGMDFNEGCEFKAIWRTAAARTLGKAKEGGDSKYDAEKRIFYAGRSLAVLLGSKPNAVQDGPKRKREDLIREFELRINNMRRMMQALIDHKQVDPIHLGGMQYEFEKLAQVKTFL